jgi:hypothetical protein
MIFILIGILIDQLRSMNLLPPILGPKTRKRRRPEAGRRAYTYTHDCQRVAESGRVARLLMLNVGKSRGMSRGVF